MNRLLVMIFSCLLPCCTANAGADAEKRTFEFSTENAGWTGDFACYPVGQETFFELAWGWDTMPAPLEVNGQTLSKGMFLNGNNHSDDLFMYIKRPIKGLRPDTDYEICFKVLIENNVPPGQFGIGGSPGEDVFFKVGASTIEPQKIDRNGTYRMNVDIGSQSESGKNTLVVGNMANPLVNPDDPQYEPKKFYSEQTLRARTDRKGRLWIFVGTDSGYEGLTIYYIAKISVTLFPCKCF